MLNSNNDLEDLVKKIEVVSNVTWGQLEKKTGREIGTA